MSDFEEMPLLFDDDDYHPPKPNKTIPGVWMHKADYDALIAETERLRDEVALLRDTLADIRGAVCILEIDLSKCSTVPEDCYQDVAMGRIRSIYWKIKQVLNEKETR